MSNIAMLKLKPKHIAVIMPIYESDKKIISMIADGYTVLEISKSLKINRRTLEAKMIKIKNRYGARTQANLVAIFLRNRLLE